MLIPALPFVVPSSEVSLARIWGLGARRAGKFTVVVSILPQSSADDGADRYEQTSLLVGSRSSAERRRIEADRGSALGCLAGRRYSGCRVGSCRNVSSVGQSKTMKLRKSRYEEHADAQSCLSLHCCQVRVIQAQ